MSAVLALLIVPKYVWWIPPTFDAQAAQAKALQFAEEAGWRVVDAKGTVSLPKVQSASYDWPMFMDTRRGYTIDLGVGAVRIEARTGKISSAHHSRYDQPSVALATPLSPEACQRLALLTIRKYSWAGKMTPVDEERSGGVERGRLRFAYEQEVLGMRFGRDRIRIEVDPTTGRILSYSCRALTPPTSFKSSLSVRKLRRAFYEQVARTFGQSELFGNASGSWSIDEPPHPSSYFGSAYRDENAKATGVVTFHLGARWPSSSRPGEQAQTSVRYDAVRGTVMDEQYTSAEDLVGIGVPAGRFPAPKREWPKAAGPIEVYTDRGTRFAHGIVKPVTTFVAHDARPVTLQFRDRVMFARYDVRRNVLQVGDRTGQPSANLADALRAVTRVGER